jgi:hypothetical protein
MIRESFGQTRYSSPRQNLALKGGCDAVTVSMEQSGYSASSAKVGCLSAGCGQSGQPFQVMTPALLENATKTKRRKRASTANAAWRQRHHRFGLSAIHRPVLAFVVTMHGSFHFQYNQLSVSRVGRFALTQSSRSTLTQRCSRKWIPQGRSYLPGAPSRREDRYCAGDIPKEALNNRLKWAESLKPHL